MSRAQFTEEEDVFQSNSPVGLIYKNYWALVGAVLCLLAIPILTIPLHRSGDDSGFVYILALAYTAIPTLLASVILYFPFRSLGFREWRPWLVVVLTIGVGLLMGYLSLSGWGRKVILYQDYHTQGWMIKNIDSLIVVKKGPEYDFNKLEKMYSKPVIYKVIDYNTMLYYYFDEDTSSLIKLPLQSGSDNIISPLFSDNLKNVTLSSYWREIPVVSKQFNKSWIISESDKLDNYGFGGWQIAPDSFDESGKYLNYILSSPSGYYDGRVDISCAFLIANGTTKCQRERIQTDTSYYKGNINDNYYLGSSLNAHLNSFSSSRYDYRSLYKKGDLIPNSNYDYEYKKVFSLDDIGLKDGSFGGYSNLLVFDGGKKILFNYYPYSDETKASPNLKLVGDDIKPLAKLTYIYIYDTNTKRATKIYESTNEIKLKAI